MKKNLMVEAEVLSTTGVYYQKNTTNSHKKTNKNSALCVLRVHFLYPNPRRWPPPRTNFLCVALFYWLNNAFHIKLNIFVSPGIMVSFLSPSLCVNISEAQLLHPIFYHGSCLLYLVSAIWLPGFSLLYGLEMCSCTHPRTFIIPCEPLI